MADPILTAEVVRRLCNYDPQTGVLTRKQNGRSVGTKTNNGYLAASIAGVYVLVHRAIWLHVHGAFPEADIDHINRVKTDNRICNLRDVPRKPNIENRGPTRANTSGVTGVYWEKSTHKWRAYIRHNYKHIKLGRFPTLAEATQARKVAERKFFAPVPELAPALPVSVD